MEKRELDNIELTEEDHKKYLEFKRYKASPSKYRKNQKPQPRFIVWPLLLIAPLFFMSLIIDNFVSNNTDDIYTQGDNPKTIGAKIGTAVSNKLKKSKIQHNNDKKNNDNNTSVASDLALTIQAVFNAMPHRPPQSIQKKILTQPKHFQVALQRMKKLTSPELLWLVDKQHALPPDYVPEDLINLKDYAHEVSINRDNLQLRKVAYDAFRSMSNVARKSDITLLASSTYRSYEYQNTVFNRIVKEKGLQEAERESARSGTSQHQLGTAIDFGSIDASFAKTPASKWLEKNASTFGYSISYPPNGENITGYIYESWHYRYIGVPAALFLDTYFEGYQQYMLEFLHYIPQESVLYEKGEDNV